MSRFQKSLAAKTANNFPVFFCVVTTGSQTCASAVKTRRVNGRGRHNRSRFPIAGLRNVTEIDRHNSPSKSDVWKHVDDERGQKKVAAGTKYPFAQNAVADFC